MSSNLAILPILLPLVAAVLVAFFPKKLKAVRLVSQIWMIVQTVIIAFITWYVLDNGTIVLESGDWVAPYGIVIVADSLSIILALTTNIVALACVFAASRSIPDRQEKFYFYTFFFLLISGVSGAFLTGDLFNLFVFFEVLLMASYALITLGGDKVQLRESLKYVLINVFSSVLFVTTVAFLYSVVGTVNMAQIAERVAESEQTGVLTAIGILLFFIFGTKAALFPLYYWLPKPYIVPNPVISALFGALLTKVGIYCIIRVFSLIFVHETEITHQLFVWIAALTLLFGAIGALSTQNIKLIIAYNVIPSIGFILMGVSAYNSTGFSGSIYYLVNDMLLKAILFLLVGAIAYLAGTSDLRKIRGMIHHYPFLGWMLLIATLALAGIPPFGGFIGKLVLLQGTFEAGEVILALIGLGVSLLMLLSVLRIFVRGFWGEKDSSIQADKKTARAFSYPIAFLLVFIIFLGIGAEWVFPDFISIGEYLMDPSIYIDSVLKE
ncbi:multicomponent Na+:H+ antiporter subunit D [Gracilibacillus halotolerans]|uniref:Multicomponent Na+:H+ antiporter subunit D n=1 Tax=Gracilibacillus halotolerans TaxID=74386 RepID=A0A841RGW1_9BACI|nr:Na+/H+ antiporter subunit D [Gracilibacillus halotolerans]MBB6511881.1 multicomponent Na+:H+ antiporter subunit D [Gracilibacillus halotolerans]